MDQSDEGPVGAGRQFPQEQGQRHRIGTARQGDGDSVIAPPEGAGPNGTKDALRQGRHQKIVEEAGWEEAGRLSAFIQPVAFQPPEDGAGAGT
jgi:hypothetical protein